MITEDVPDDALAIARGRQANKPGRGFRGKKEIELMCGIVGVVGKADAAPLLLEALRRLEYRGYDSAGIATLVDGHVERRRAEGKLGNLAAVLERDPLSGTTGIGHTRWATHGAPTERNAHPHSTRRVSVVHNGIIENHAELRAELEAKGAVFETETDTETFVRLLDDLLAPGAGAAGGLRRRAEAGAWRLRARRRLRRPSEAADGGAAGRAAGDRLRRGRDVRRLRRAGPGPADPPHRLSRGGRLGGAGHATAPPSSMRSDHAVERKVVVTAVSGAAVGKGNYRHFMEKELHEHPAVLGDTLRQYLDPKTLEVRLPRLPFDPAKVPRLTISACGSAFLAGPVGRYWIEQLARLPVDADVASEFRYRNPPLTEGGAAILVSQSGETADTMAALKLLQEGRAEGAVGRQRPEILDGAGERRRGADGGGAGDRRRLDQGLHRAARGHGLPGDRLRPGAAGAVDAG